MKGSGIYKIFFLCLLAFVPSRSESQELILYAIPPPKPLDWQSPRSLFITMFHNSFTGKKICGHRRAMGHVLVELKDKTHDEIASEIAQNKRSLYYPVFFKGYGMGILFANIPGKLEEKNEIKKELEQRDEEGKVAYIRFKLSDSTFNRLLEYITVYKKRQYYKIYNGKNLPRDGSGAGCSALGYSFIELGNLLNKDETNKWLIDKPVPECLLGGPNYKKKRVSFFKILRTRSWTTATKQQYYIAERYDPLLMYKWIVAKWGEHTNPPSVAELTAHAKGIVIDCQNIPTPTESIWTRKDYNVILKLTRK